MTSQTPAQLQHAELQILVAACEWAALPRGMRSIAWRIYWLAGLEHALQTVQAWGGPDAL